MSSHRVGVQWLLCWRSAGVCREKCFRCCSSLTVLVKYTAAAAYGGVSNAASSWERGLKSNALRREEAK